MRANAAMRPTRIVDSDEEDSDSQANNVADLRHQSDDDFIDDSEDVSRPARKRARFSAAQKGKGRAAAAAAAAALADTDDEGGAGEEDDDDDAGEVAEGLSGSKKKGSKATFSWEEEYSRSWDQVTEDVHGSLEGAVAAFLTSNKRRRILRDTTSIQRGIIRHLYLVIDLSESMTDRDMRPSRLELSLKYAQEFVAEFFDQNPISQLAIIATRDGMAERISNLGGNPVEHVKALQNKRKLMPSGEPSLQNALNMARSGLACVVADGCRRRSDGGGQGEYCDLQN